MNLSKFKAYRKTGLQLMRPYEAGEDMLGISVANTDVPEVGGMIAVDPSNTEDIWYIAKEFFNTNYELVI